MKCTLTLHLETSKHTVYLHTWTRDKIDARWIIPSVYTNIPCKSSGLWCEIWGSRRGCSRPPAMERLHKFRSWRKLPRHAKTVHATALEGDELPCRDQCLGTAMILSKSNEIVSIIKPFQQAPSPNLWFARNPNTHLWLQYVTLPSRDDPPSSRGCGFSWGCQRNSSNQTSLQAVPESSHWTERSEHIKHPNAEINKLTTLLDVNKNPPEKRKRKRGKGIRCRKIHPESLMDGLFYQLNLRKTKRRVKRPIWKQWSQFFPPVFNMFHSTPTSGAEGDAALFGGGTMACSLSTSSDAMISDKIMSTNRPFFILKFLCHMSPVLFFHEISNGFKQNIQWW